MGLVSIYLVRPLIAVAVCVAAALLVEGPADRFAQVALVIPTLVALLLCAIDWNRMAFGAAGFVGAAVLGLTVAGREASETITGYDLTFLVNWAIISAFSGLPVYGIWYVWGATGEVRRGIDELVDLRNDHRRGVEEPDTRSRGATGESGPGPAETIPGAPASGAGPTGVDPPATARTAATTSEKPANFAAEELVASIEAYQVNGQPWWKCMEPHVIVQYGDRAQMELESRVVPFLGWARELAPVRRPGTRVQRKPGLFTFQFAMGQKPPEDDLTVTWTRAG